MLALPYKLRWLEAQSYTLREGDKPDRCAILVSGYAFRHKLTGDGNRQILSLHIPGDALDFQNMFLDESDHNVQMLTRGQVAEVPSRPLEDLVLNYPAVGRAILIHTLVEASIFREWVVNIGRRDAREPDRASPLRIRLSAFDPRSCSAQEYSSCRSRREQLADATGLTAVHVNRVLKSLQAEGLIDRNRRIVSFPNWQGLGTSPISIRAISAPELAN